MSKDDFLSIRKVVEAELKAERLKAINKRKELKKRKWYNRLFPWKITVVRYF